MSKYLENRDISHYTELTELHRINLKSNKRSVSVYCVFTLVSLNHICNHSTKKLCPYRHEIRDDPQRFLYNDNQPS